MTPLMPREMQVLTTVIEEYIASAQPVGSRTVAKKSGIGISPASIRNIMSDLTEKGYLSQPHTSAGRVPTSQAFRVYLSGLSSTKPPDEKVRAAMDLELRKAGVAVEAILRQASRILSQYSFQVSMAITPKPKAVRWTRIEFALLRPGLVMAMLALQEGIGRTKLIETENDFTQDELVACSNYLNHIFACMPLDKARKRLEREMDLARRTLNVLYSRALHLASVAMLPEFEREVYVEGAASVFSRSDFSNMEELKELFKILEEKAQILELLDRTMEIFATALTLDGSEGGENSPACGFISAPYGNQGELLGAVGLIGPLRMDYAKLVPVVDMTAGLLTRLLSEHFNR